MSWGELLRLLNRREAGREIARSGGVFVASCCVMALGVASCWAGDPVEPASGRVAAASGHNWSLKLPDDGTVAFSGMLEYDGASVGSNPMMYPAPNAAAFIASVITHGLIVESQKNSQRKRAQEYADRVLEPYRPILEAITYQQLAHSWTERTPQGETRKLIGPSEGAADGEWLMEAKPVFSMAQNQRTLRLDASITVRAPGDADKAASPFRVLMISPAVESENPAGAWTEGEGKAFREVSAWLFAESLDIAMRAATDGVDSADRPFRTIRYVEGGAEKMERAQLIREHCGRAVIKTLRGTLMSVPLKEPVSGAVDAQVSCAQS